MNTRSLNKLHNTGNENIVSVADCINLNFLTANILINKNGLVLIDFNCSFKVVAKLTLVCNYLHSASTKHEARTYKHGITYFSRRLNTIFNPCNRASLGLRNLKLLKKLFKRVAVFCFIYGFTIRSNYLNAKI